MTEEAEEAPTAPEESEAPAAPPEKASPKAKANRMRSFALAAGVVVALAGGGLYYGLSRPDAPAPIDARETPKSALDAVPAGATLLVTIDLEALRKSPLAAPYLAGERSIEGIGKIRDACGFDPLASVNQLALAVPEAYDADFGVVAVGTVADGPVLDCATKVIAARGGKPVSSSLGSFRTVRDMEAPTTGEIAVRAGGPLLFGGGGFLRAMVDAVDGTLPSAKTEPAHTELRKELAGFESIQATLALSKKQRAVIAEELASTPSAPAAIGAVSAVAAGVSLVDQNAKIKIVLLCDDPPSASALVTLANDARKNAGQSPQAALLGAAPLLERLALEAHGAKVIATLEANVAELDAIVERAMQFRAMMEGGRQAPEPSGAVPSGAVPPTAPPTGSASSGPGPRR
ncbi:MAG: hypothetical protein HOV80_32685 [Polyangiaceae bacterium]|nr:hypothetical protein [Polyangiaceae bacterium]